MSSGFASNGPNYRFLLNKLDDCYSTTYNVSCSNNVLKPSDPKIQKSVMERTGFWSNASKQIIGESPYERNITLKQRYNESKNLTNQRILELKKNNPIEAENNGLGPLWGDTTAKSSYVLHSNPADRYFSMNKSLIGPQTHTPFSRELAIRPIYSERPQTTYEDSYKRPIGPEIKLSNNTRMENSGYTRTQNFEKCKDSFKEDNYSINNSTYRCPTVSYTMTGGNRRGTSGYLSNETIIVGSPGDSRLFKTGKSVFQKSFKGGYFHNNNSSTIPNVVQRSGFWT